MPICRNVIDSDQFFTTCAHVFHGFCVSKWLQKENTCPLCRKVQNHSNQIDNEQDDNHKDSQDDTDPDNDQNDFVNHTIMTCWNFSM